MLWNRWIGVCWRDSEQGGGPSYLTLHFAAAASRVLLVSNPPSLLQLWPSLWNDGQWRKSSASLTPKLVTDVTALITAIWARVSHLDPKTWAEFRHLLVLSWSGLGRSKQPSSSCNVSVKTLPSLSPESSSWPVLGGYQVLSYRTAGSVLWKPEPKPDLISGTGSGRGPGTELFMNWKRIPDFIKSKEL